MDLNLYVDPLTMLGHDILTNGIYEPDIIKIFKSEINKGDIVLDVGANEGIYAALSGKLVGDQGLVIAVEPQSRLRDIIDINLALNRVANCIVYTNALGGPDDEEITLHLYPAMNTGASSILRRYRFSRKTEKVKCKRSGGKVAYYQCLRNDQSLQNKLW